MRTGLRSPYTWEKGFSELHIYSNLITNGYLWDEIRLKNGAYGVNCQQYGAKGLLSIITTQDPSPKDTFQIFNCIPKIPMDTSDKECSDAIISSLKGFLSPTRQIRGAQTALSEFMSDLTDDIIDQTVEKCLRVTPASLKKSVTEFFESEPLFNDCVIGPEKAVSPLEMSRLEI